MKSIDVVILDDELYILNALKRFFRKEAFGIYYATSHKEALKILEVEDVKVVISDHKMPDILGLDFLKIVQEKWPNIVRLIFTGYSNLQRVQDALQQGQVYKVIDKPWKDQEFRALVCEAIEKFDNKKN
jgi:DNA-binding NtrC family response regulator